MITERDQELLNRFIDGELSVEEAAEFEARLQASDDLVAMRDEFVQMGSALREHVAAELNEVDLSGFFDGVIARLDPDEMPVVDSEPTAIVTEREDESLFGNIKNWWANNWTPVLVGAAAAAAIAFWLGQTPQPTPVQAPQVAEAPGTEGSSSKSIVASDKPSEAKSANVVVDAIRNEGNKAILVSQPVEDDGAMVIWLLDEEEEEEQPVDGEDPI